MILLNISIDDFQAQGQPSPSGKARIVGHWRLKGYFFNFPTKSLTFNSLPSYIYISAAGVEWNKLTDKTKYEKAAVADKV
jgi:hypothetical protein